MIVVNFSHVLTADQIKQVELLTGQTVERVIEVASQVDLQQPLASQVKAMADAAGLTPAEWQSLPLLVNPPSLSHSAVLMIAELYDRCGYFPPCLRLRPVKDALPPRFEVAEIMSIAANPRSSAARILGRARSPRKASAARENGRLGGRPRRTLAE